MLLAIVILRKSIQRKVFNSGNVFRNQGTMYESIISRKPSVSNEEEIYIFRKCCIENNIHPILPLIASYGGSVEGY